MILVTGGLGFIGSHTVRALQDVGESCVLLQRRNHELPDDLDDGRTVVEPGDVTDLASLADVGLRHDISGIVHLAGSMPWPDDGSDPVAATRSSLAGLLNLVQLGQEWGVRRLGVASTIGVYGGVTTRGALTEDTPLTIAGSHVIPTFKKVGELLGDYLATATALDIVSYRISGTWGPRGHEDPFFAAPALVHAAARGVAPDLSGLQVEPRTGDSLDLCYVKDTGRAIALLQLADQLEHRTYNVASGRATSNAEIIAAIGSVVPNARVSLPEGDPGTPSWLDITRLHEETGYTPEYDVERSVADYVAWLRAGHER